jgi:site-specific recombinase XerD
MPRKSFLPGPRWSIGLTLTATAESPRA